MSSKEVKIIISAVDNFSKAFNQLDDEIAQLGKATEKISGAFDDFANASGSGKLQKMAGEFAKIATAMGTVQGRAGLAVRAVSEVVQAYVKLYDASKKNFVSGLEKIGTVCSTILGGLGKVGGGFLELLQGVTGADLSFGGLVKSSAQFEENLKRVVNMNGSLRGDMEKSNKVYYSLTEAAQKWALDSQYSTDQISAGMVQMTQAGLDYKEVLNSIGATIALSTAGNLDFARSAEILTNTMNAFKETAFDEKTTMKYANVLTGVANSSATSVDQIGQALVNFGASAGLMGYKIEEVGISIGLMGNQFIKSGRAGTAMKNIITRVTGANSSAKKAIDEYNLEAFEQEMINGNLTQAFKELIKATEGYDKATKNKIATDIAGSYGAQGLLTIMGSTVEELEKMEVAIKQNGDAWGIHTGMMETTYGKFLQLSSIIQVLGTELMNVFGPAINGALGGMVEFAKSLFHISGEGENCIVRLKSLAEIAEMSKGWGESLANGIRKAITGLKEFVSGPQIDQLMTIGTNIIQGICKGISNNKVDLQETFSTAIQKACKFIGENSEAIGQAGKDILDALGNAIRENEDIIKVALDDLMGIVTEWAKGGANIEAAMGLFADSMINALVDQAIVKATGRGGEIWNAMWSGVTLEDGANIKNGEGQGGLGSMFAEDSPNGFLKMLGSADKSLNDWLVGGIKKVGQGVWNWFTGTADAAEVSAAEGGKLIGKTTGENVKVAFDEQGQPIVESATKTGTDAAAGIQAALQGMDLQYLQSLGQEMTNLGTLTSQMATSMSTSFTNITNSARTSFTGFANIVRNQMLNVSNIIRNQMLNATNIVKNQATNMANATRTSFVNMANIARNQFVNIANICRNQMLNCTNIVKNQMTNMNNATRTAFVNMANICRNQMTNCTNIVRNQASNMSTALSQGMSKMASAATSAMAKVVAAVRSGMAQARAIASAPITINIQSNISRKVTTTHVAGGLMQTMGNISRSSITVPRPNVMTTGGGASINRIPTQEKAYAFTIPVMVDGREVARATAKYSQAELDKLNKRNSRKRGE